MNFKYKYCSGATIICDKAIVLSNPYQRQGTSHKIYTKFKHRNLRNLITLGSESLANGTILLVFAYRRF